MVFSPILWSPSGLCSFWKASQATEAVVPFTERRGKDIMKPCPKIKSEFNCLWCCCRWQAGCTSLLCLVGILIDVPGICRMAWPAHSQPLLTAGLRAARSFPTWKSPITSQESLAQAMHKLAQPEFFLPSLPLQHSTDPCG